jgi:hypothetical protein
MNCRLCQPQDKTPIDFDLAEFLTGKPGQHIAGDTPVIDGSGLIQHDVGIGLQRIARREPVTQGFGTLDQLARQWQDGDAWVTGLNRSLCMTRQGRILPGSVPLGGLNLAR